MARDNADQSTSEHRHETGEPEVLGYRNQDRGRTTYGHVRRQRHTSERYEQSDGERDESARSDLPLAMSVAQISCTINPEFGLRIVQRKMSMKVVNRPGLVSNAR